MYIFAAVMNRASKYGFGSEFQHGKAVNKFFISNVSIDNQIFTNSDDIAAVGYPTWSGASKGTSNYKIKTINNYKMKLKSKKRSVAMALLVSAMLLLPTGLMAQSDGFFSNYSGGERDGGEGTGATITNEGFSTEAPLGGGLAILVASAAGYALLKRRNEQDC